MPFVLVKRAFRALLVVCVLVLPMWQTQGANAGPRDATMVLDANTGRILHASQADEPRFPASLTKMMTLYIVFGEIEAGRMSYATKIKVSERAAGQPPSKLDLDPGEEITAINAIKALVTKSANDVAVALAEHVAGSEPAFARLMTERARQIGMGSTTFRNASGLPDVEQLTTARDMITLGLRLHDDFPRHWSLFATRSFPYEGNTYRNHNTMLATYEGVDGIKTGYTRASGFNIVSSVRRNGKHVLVAVFGGASAGQRNVVARDLLNRTLLQASPVKTRRAAPPPMLVATARPAPRPQRVVAPPPPPPPPQPIEMARRPAPPLPAQAPDAADRAAITQLFAEAAAAPSVATPMIDIARVRPVLLAHTPADTTVGAAVAPNVGSDQAEPVVSGSERPWTGRAGAFAVPSLAAGAPLMTSNDALGRAPSTLGAQARALTGGVDAAAEADATDTPPSAFVEDRRRLAARSVVAPSLAGGFHLQVGAYSSAGEAERMLNATRSRTGDLLREYAQAAIEVHKDNRRLYRARFTGFDPARAANVCTELRRQQIDCFVMKAE